MQSKPILILAYGNPSRGDDALGPLLLEHIENFPAALLEQVECLTDFQLQIEHALDLKHRQLVLFIDAGVGLEQPFKFTQLQSAYDNSYSTHAMNPAAVMQVYADIEETAPPPCFMLTLQGTEFELGAGLSTAAEHSLQQASVFVKKLLNVPTFATWQPLAAYQA